MSDSNDLSNPFVSQDICWMIAHPLEGVGFNVGRTLHQDTEAFRSQRMQLVAPIVATTREAIKEKCRPGSGSRNVHITLCVSRATAQLHVPANGGKTMTCGNHSVSPLISRPFSA